MAIKIIILLLFMFPFNLSTQQGKPTGKIVFSGGTGESFTGTATFVLWVDSLGNIITDSLLASEIKISATAIKRIDCDKGSITFPSYDSVATRMPEN